MKVKLVPPHGASVVHYVMAKMNSCVIRLAKAKTKQKYWRKRRRENKEAYRSRCSRVFQYSGTFFKSPQGWQDKKQKNKTKQNKNSYEGWQINWSSFVMMQVDVRDLQVMDNSVCRSSTSVEKITNKRLGEKKMCRHCSLLVLRCGFSG